MSQPHRGLPPPAAMTLPDPGRGPPPPPPPSISQSLSQMPAPPPHWQGAEESMRNWLMTKAEEEKRKQEEERTRQEEERTRQETLRLEQRKIEQAMLRESMQGGVPLHLVPMIFAGIGSGNLSNVNVDWLQQNAPQLQAQQQQQAAGAQGQLSPDLRRDSRLINPPQTGVYGVGPQAQQPSLPAASVLQGQPLGGQAPLASSFSTASYAQGTMSPSGRPRSLQAAGQAGAPAAVPRPPIQAQLPTLTTNEMQTHQPPTAPPGVQALQQSQGSQEQQSSSPSIYFHHWVPPTSQAGSDYTSSPKKRKAHGTHPAPPPPTSTPQYTSPSFSQVSSSGSTPGRRGHGRTRSDASTRGYEGPGRPQSRHGIFSSHVERYERGGLGEAEHLHRPTHQQTQQPQQTHHHLGQRVPEERPERLGITGSHDNDGNGGEHGPPIQRETRQSAQSQHSAGPERGSAPVSPKREAAASSRQ